MRHFCQVDGHFEVMKFLSFENMGLKPELLRGVQAYGWERPAGVQQRAIVPTVKGLDVIVRDRAGTAKTTALAISVIQQVDVSIQSTQILILVATRELAQQLQSLIVALGDFMDIKCHACVGGIKVREDIAKLLEIPHIVVGTPGRTFDMIQRNVLKTDAIKLFCFDEADEMFARGFKDPIYETYALLPKGVQVILLTATLPADVEEATQTFMSNPVKIILKWDQVNIEGFKHFFVAVEKDEEKIQELVKLYETISLTQAVIFCNLKRTVTSLAEMMYARGFKTSVVHTELDEATCNNLIHEFRSGSSRILVTTDQLSARVNGNVGGISLVINYDLPATKNDYGLRLCPGGSFGRKGVAINFITSVDVRMLKDIEQYYHIHIDKMVDPDLKSEKINQS
ncbi:DEAD-domain-containing protein [Crepidotus variabilis]|uniref:RNA helicase n=1 Tax=Crepidotus variabilis TaxID=179855 RepID=A0A9P6JTS1_9AGAR|nr:DEAD-domain-containing protein [Crepidotus variabilis]